MDDNYNMAWRLDKRGHPAVTLPNDIALHSSVRGPVACVSLTCVQGGEKRACVRFDLVQNKERQGRIEGLLVGISGCELC